MLPDRRHEDEGASPAALGNRIAAAAIESGLADASNEAGGYTSDYAPVSAPLEVAARGPDRMEDPNRWQPLQLEQAVSQNGIHRRHRPAVRTALGFVTGFALPDPGDEGVPMDPGPPPLLDPGPDDDFKTAPWRVHRQERPARPRSRGHDRYLPRRPRRQRARNERR